MRQSVNKSAFTLTYIIIFFVALSFSSADDAIQWGAPQGASVSAGTPSRSIWLQSGYRYMVHVYETGWGEWPDERWYTQILLEENDGYVWQAGTPILTINDLTPYDTQPEAWEAGEKWITMTVPEDKTVKVYMHHTPYTDHLWGHANVVFYKFPVFTEPVSSYSMESLASPTLIPADGFSSTDISAQLYKEGAPYGGEDGSEHTEYIKVTTDKGSFSGYDDRKEGWIFYSSFTGDSIPLYADTEAGEAHVRLEWWAHRDNPIVQYLTVKMGDYVLTVNADTGELPADGTSTSQISVAVDPYTGAIGNTVTLTANKGTFTGGLNTVEVPLDGSGHGTATFVAPSEMGFCYIHGEYGDAADTAKILAQGKTLQLKVSPDTLPADSAVHGQVKVRLLDEWYSPISGESITLTTDMGTFQNGLQTMTVTSEWEWVSVSFIPEDNAEGIAHVYASCNIDGDTLTAGEEINIFNDRLIIQTSPTWLESDGEEISNLTISLFLGGLPAGAGNIIWLSTDRGTLKSGESSGSNIMLETNGGGMAYATLTASDDPGLATVLAEYLPGGLSATATVPMTELEIDGELFSVSATGVPATTASETLDVPREEDDQGNLPSEVTLYGSTEVKIRVQLSDPFDKLQKEYRPIQLICPRKDAIGSAYIDLPASGETDDNGIFEFTLTAQNLYDCGQPLDSITVTAVTTTITPPLSKEFTIQVIDNMDLLMDIYQTEILEGAVVLGELFRTLDKAGFDVSLQRKFREFLNNKNLGHWNNTLSSVFFDWVPGQWNNQFDLFVCGNYQKQVLTLLNALRLNATTYGQTSWLLNGLDYAPVGIGGGAHLAAMIYPRVSGPGDWAGDNTLVLDPWLTQSPQSYTWTEWHDALGTASLSLPGLIVHPWSLYGTTQMNQYFPANGHDYPPTADTLPGTDILDMYEGLIIDCPVYVMIEDSEGRQSGYDPNGTLVYEIPDLWRDTVKLDDDTTGWYFELPKDVLTVTLTGYGNGPMTISRIGELGRFEQYQVLIADGQTCQLVLDPNHPDLEVLTMDSGQIILSDDSLAFGTWNHNAQTLQTDAILTFTNTSNTSIYSPMRATAEDLRPAAVSVTNADGIDNGNWYWDLPVAGLATGQSVSIPVSFAGVDEPNGFDILITLRGYDDSMQTHEVICTRKDFVQGLPECGDDNHPLPPGDLNRDCIVDLDDAALLSFYWLQDNCAEDYNCGGVDLMPSGRVDFDDAVILTDHWLDDTSPQ